MSAGGLIGATFGRRVTTEVGRRLRALRNEDGFTLIELAMAAMVLMIISVPISGMISQSAVISKLARERTGADQMAQQQIEAIRALPYVQVGLVHGNPDGLMVASDQTALPGGEQVLITRTVTYVADPIPTAPVTNADYKKVVVTITRVSDNHVLSQKTTFVSSASAPPYQGTTWVQIKRTVIDAVTTSVLPGATVNLTGGPDNVNRNDTTDGAGNVLFPALTSAASSTPVFTLATTLTGYNVFPDDLPTGSAETVPSTPGLNSINTIRMYKPTTLTVNVLNSSGSAWNSGANVTVDSSRCGVQQATIGAGGNTITFTTCTAFASTSVPLPPNVTGLTPADDQYYVTAWSTNGSGNWSTGTAVTVPTSYPSNLTKSVNVQWVSTAYSTTKQIKVTVTKGGSNDPNARVEILGTPTGMSTPVHMFGTTNSSGQVTITVPVTSTSTTFSIYANDMGVQKQSSSPVPTVSLNSSSTSPATITVPIS